MAAKKKEGFDGLKEATGKKFREDRELLDRTTFDPLNVDAKNVVTVVCLLQSPEELIQLRAVVSLEIYGSKCSENLELLCSLGIFADLFPILQHPDFVARRFTLKLIAMLSAYDDFRQEMLKKEDILEVFMNMLAKESDAVLQEYASFTLAELSKDYHVAAELLKLENCWAIFFMRITSADPDIEKNCLDIMHNLLYDINGIEAFIEAPGIELKSILNLIYSSYPVIQAAALGVLKLLTSWCRDTRVLVAFREAEGLELCMNILETKNYSDLHSNVLDLMINVLDCPAMCEYLLQSGCLMRFVGFLDNIVDVKPMESILAVLARFALPQDGSKALHSVDMEQRFISYLEVGSDTIQESSCLGVANMSQYAPALLTLIDLNPVMVLVGIITDREKNFQLRNLAAYALNVMCNVDVRPLNTLLEEDTYKSLLAALIEAYYSCSEFCENIIQTFIAAVCCDIIRPKLVNEDFLSAIINCVFDGRPTRKDPSLQVDALECLSEFLVDSEARYLFNVLNGVDIILCALRSNFASVREWAGHLVVVASQSKDFVKNFILKNGLQWMLKEKNTMYSMPSWQSAIETIFANCLPAKFAYTGRLDFQDITQDGFFISVNPRIKFMLLDHFIELMISPVAPLYVAIFNAPPGAGDSGGSSQISLQKPQEFQESQELQEPQEPQEPQKPQKQEKKHDGEEQNLKKYMKGADRNSLEEYQWTGSLLSYLSVDYDSVSFPTKEHSFMYKFTADPYLNECLESLKKKITKEELQFVDVSWCSVHPRIVRNRARIIAEFVADEMSGFEPDLVGCNAHYKSAHINELKYHLGTNILPLGLIRIGDYLERAMLFKVLADRIGFPCALVRGSNNRTWIEIAVPVVNVEFPGEKSLNEKSNSFSVIPETPELQKLSENSISDSEKTSSQNSSETLCIESAPEEEFWFPKIQPELFKGLPQNFLKPNAIVDLVIQPGRILDLNSYEAKEYRGFCLFE